MSKKEDRTVDGIVFASKKEAQRYIKLKKMEEEGKIRNLEIQPEFKIHVRRKFVCKYVADFRYRQGRRVVVEDVKGFKTSTYRLKKKLVKAALGIDIVEV